MKHKPDEIACLYEITKAIYTTLDLRKALYKVLDLMSEHLGMNRGSIALLNRDTSEIHIEVAHGISISERTKGRYKLGEGVTGRVIETGRPMAVPKIDDEPLFLDRMGARSRIDKSTISFICVPIKEGRKVIGALSVDRVFEGPSPLNEDVRLLTVISTLIVQKVAMLEKINRERDRLEEENLRLRRELDKKYSFANIIGNSRKVQEVFYLITQVAKSNANVLLLGESGTGKELVANAIHYNSLRSTKPLVKVNCAALPENLIEAELFGYEKGAFTGADRQRIGKFEQCSGGTIFLDEVGDMSQLTQGKVLRLLQEQKFERVGGNKTIETDVRIIAATNRNLETMVKDGSFREDLFYRLNGMTISLPPLRERGKDVALLVEHYLNVACYEMGRTETEGMSAEALELLTQYRWPGNVRELQSVVRQSLLNSTSPIIIPTFLPDELYQSSAISVTEAVPTPSATGDTFPLSDMRLIVDERLTANSTDLYSETLEAMERYLLTRILNETSGNQTRAAEILGITRGKIRDRIAQFGISLEKTVSIDDDVK